MSVGLYKYDGNIFEDAKEVLSEYLLSRLKNMKEVIPKSLENDEDVLYIF